MKLTDSLELIVQVVIKPLGEVVLIFIEQPVIQATSRAIILVLVACRDELDWVTVAPIRNSSGQLAASKDVFFTLNALESRNLNSTFKEKTKTLYLGFCVLNKLVHQ